MKTFPLALVILFFLVLSTVKAGASVHAMTSLPELIQQSDAICIGHAVPSATEGQIGPALVSGPNFVQLKVQRVLKGTIKSSSISAYVGSDTYVDTNWKTAIFFLNGNSKGNDWSLAPAYPQPILPLGGVDVHGATSSTVPFYFVLSVLCKALPSLDKQDRLQVLYRMEDIQLLLNPNNRNPDVAHMSATLGGFPKIRTFAEGTIFSAIEQLYNNVDGETQTTSLRLGAQLRDTKAISLLKQQKN